MTRMCNQDWEIVALWQEHGIPVDGTTVETSLEIINKLAAEVERRDALIEELMLAYGKVWVGGEQP